MPNARSSGHSRGDLTTLPTAPPELRRFLERAEEVPAWADFDEMKVGALAYQRFGILGMIVLSAWSLKINGYHSSAAVKPLAFTGELHHNAQRRLAETARFVSGGHPSRWTPAAAARATRYRCVSH